MHEIDISKLNKRLLGVKTPGDPSYILSGVVTSGTCMIYQ